MPYFNCDTEIVEKEMLLIYGCPVYGLSVRYIGCHRERIHFLHFTWLYETKPGMYPPKFTYCSTLQLQ